jgi:ABC-type amino acid transport substrate-binding protein/ABC-type amino acid transport system permease subunit
MLIRMLQALLILLLASAPWSAQAEDPAEDLGATLAKARAAAASRCGELANSDRLYRVLCANKIRIGVRDNYPRFAEKNQDQRSGFEIDLAKTIGETLGVAVEFVDVAPVSRISSLTDDRIDLVIATMGHNTLRDSSARFILPHYYSSQTVVVGPKKIAIASWADMADKTVCTTVGNYSNALMVPRVARLMLFDSPARLLANLRSASCTFIAQDDSVLAAALADPEFSARFDAKIGFGEIPWGMAVSLDGSDALAAVLDQVLATYHRDGTMLALAKQHTIATDFLARMQVLWSHEDCKAAPTKCVAPPFELQLAPGPFKGFVEDAFTWAQNNLSVFYSAVAWDLFTGGIVISLIAVAGVLVATFFLALFFASGMSSSNKILRIFFSSLLAVFQSSPPILVLIVVAALANELFAYSQPVALLVAILSIGLMNGAFAGQSINDARKSLRQDQNDSAGPADAGPVPHEWRRAIVRAAPQIEAFLANATRGISAASFVGVADLTNALNDITSFSRSQSMTYWILLAFYVAVLLIVVRLCRFGRSALEASSKEP